MKIFSTQGTLAPRAPFDFEKTLDFIGAFVPMIGEQTLAPRSMTKTISVEGIATVFQLLSGGSVAQPALAYTLYSAHRLDADAQRQITNHIRFFLSLDDDLNAFYALAARDEKYQPVIQRFYGLHHVKFLTPFENAVWAVLTQRTPMRVAQTIKRALIEQYGPSLTVNGQEYRAFPEVNALYSVSPENLNTLVHNERKTMYLCAVIEAFHQVSDEFLQHAPTEQVRAWLLNIKGIGEWSADFILLRGLGRMEHLRMSESTLRGDPFGSAIAKVYANGLRKRMAVGKDIGHITYARMNDHDESAPRRCSMGAHAGILAECRAMKYCAKRSSPHYIAG